MSAKAGTGGCRERSGEPYIPSTKKRDQTTSRVGAGERTRKRTDTRKGTGAVS